MFELAFWLWFKIELIFWKKNNFWYNDRWILHGSITFNFFGSHQFSYLNFVYSMLNCLILLLGTADGSRLKRSLKVIDGWLSVVLISIVMFWSRRPFLFENFFSFYPKFYLEIPSNIEIVAVLLFGYYLTLYGTLFCGFCLDVFC